LFFSSPQIIYLYRFSQSFFYFTSPDNVRAPRFIHDP
jgi:hypothetical protein